MNLLLQTHDILYILTSKRNSTVENLSCIACGLQTQANHDQNLESSLGVI